MNNLKSNFLAQNFSTLIYIQLYSCLKYSETEIFN